MVRTPSWRARPIRSGNTGTASLSFTLDTTRLWLRSQFGRPDQPGGADIPAGRRRDAGATVTILDWHDAVGRRHRAEQRQLEQQRHPDSGSNSLTAKVNDLAGNPAPHALSVYTLSTTGPDRVTGESLAFEPGSPRH